MSRFLPAAAILAAAALAACGNDEGPEAGFLFAEPSAVAPFHGRTTKHAAVHPYLAVANSGSNDLTIVDGVDDSVVAAPVPLRSLVFPVPGRPALLASSGLGDDDPAVAGDERPDLLVAVSAGAARLQVIRTWEAAGGVAFDVALGADVLALVPLPSAPGTARVAAALSGGSIAVVEFARQAGGDAIEQSGDVQPSAALGFQPVALAAMPDDPDVAGIQTMLYAATPDLDGVAELAVPPGAAPSFAGRVLAAGAPTRLVAAARLREALGSAVRDAAAFGGALAVERVYAVLDESGCGPAAPIACGLVALDVLAGGLVADPFTETPEDVLAPIPIPGQALALGAVPPPAVSPTADPVYAGTIMRVQTAEGVRATTGAAAVAGTDAAVQFVDLGRWELPSEQAIHPRVGATVSSPQGRVATAAGSTPVDQWLVLSRFDPETSTTISVDHADAAGLAAAVELTPGYTPGTPSERWTVTYQGALPGLSSRRADAPSDSEPLLAVQVPGGGGFADVARLYDPTLGVAAGDTVDTVVVEAPDLPGCASFEADVAELRAPTAQFPGGAVLLGKKSAHPEWDACVDAIRRGATGLRATFLAGEYVLVRGTGTAAVHVGRPVLGERFALEWQPEGALASCALPPAVEWPGGACDAICREACEELIRVRMARRIGYVTETCGTDARCLERWPALPNVSGPALGFTLALENPALDPPPRGLTLTIDTTDGRAPFRVGPGVSGVVDPRGVAVFDRSPRNAGAGVRVLVPYTSGVVLDATPTVQGGNPVTLR